MNMIEINDSAVLYSATTPQKEAVTTDDSGFTISIRYLRALPDGESISVGIELCDNTRNLTETRRYSVLIELWNDLKLRRGPISREKLEEIEQASQLSAAYARALAILAYGANSAHALTLKLRQRGFDATHAQSAVDLVRTHGYLREEQDARREAERCLSKGWGNRRIAQYLRQRGYDADAIETAMEQTDLTDDIERCTHMARRKSPTPPPDAKEKQKLIGYLLRQGYDMSAIRHAMEDAWAEE